MWSQIWQYGTVYPSINGIFSVPVTGKEGSRIRVGTACVVEFSRLRCFHKNWENLFVLFCVVTQNKRSCIPQSCAWSASKRILQNPCHDDRKRKNSFSLSPLVLWQSRVECPWEHVTVELELNHQVFRKISAENGSWFYILKQLKHAISALVSMEFIPHLEFHRF